MPISTQPAESDGLRSILCSGNFTFSGGAVVARSNTNFTVTRTAVGTFRVTFDARRGTLESCVAGVNNQTFTAAWINDGTVGGRNFVDIVTIAAGSATDPGNGVKICFTAVYRYGRTY